MMTYRRLMTDQEPDMSSMKVTRMQDDERYIILGITDVDEQMKEHNAAQKILEEQVAYNRITALAGDFFCIYVVDPETGQYREFSATAGFDTFDLPAEGNDFFDAFRVQALSIVYPEDQSRFLSMLTKENVLRRLSRVVFSLSATV